MTTEYKFDYKRRIVEYQQTLRESNVDFALVLKPANIRYLCGFWGYVTRYEYSEPRRLICLAVPAEGTPVLVVPKIEYVFARRATEGTGVSVKRHVEWEEDSETEDAWGIVRDTLGSNRQASNRVRVEREFITRRAYEAIIAAFDGYELLGSDYVIENLRMIKDQTEVDLLRACGKVAVGQLEIEIQKIMEGNVREYEVALEGLQYACEQCAVALEGNEVNSPLGEGVQLVTSGPRLAMPHGAASARRIGPDDVVMMDFCRVPYVLGYRIGMGRVVSQRPLTSEEQDMEATIQEAYETALEYLMPDVPCSDVEAATRDILVEGGLGEFIAHRNGRGVGIENVELPEIKEGVDTRLRPNMVLSIEPSIYKDGFASRVENTVLITTDGPEVITPAPAALRYIR